ncbi:hypothetical protein ACJX0J_009880, partial [Zea mays]
CNYTYNMLLVALWGAGAQIYHLKQIIIVLFGLCCGLFLFLHFLTQIYHLKQRITEVCLGL